MFIETDYINDYILGPVHVVSLQMALRCAQFQMKLLTFKNRASYI